MKTTQAPAALTKEETNIRRYANLLLQEGATIPSIVEHAPLGDYNDIAVEMFDARVKRGVSGVKAYIDHTLRNLKEPKYKRLINLLCSDNAPTQDTSETTIEFVHITDTCPPLPDGVVIDEKYTQGVTPLKDAYVTYSKEKSPEGYEDFHHSCYWGMLSTVAARRVVINLASQQHTQMIIQLAARSTLYVKTVTAEVQREVLRAAGLHWLLGISRTTPQKLLHDMAGSVPENYGELDATTQADIRQRLAMSGQRGWLYQEFGKLIKAMVRTGPMSDFVEILLQISDCPPTLDTGTIARGTELITNPYLAITGTLTPASIKAVAGRSTELWSDGFLARFVFSCPPPNSHIDSPFRRGQIFVPGELTTGIRAWHEMLGEPQIAIEPVREEDGKETGRYEKIIVKELPETVYTLSDAAYEAWSKYRSALKSLLIKFNSTDFDGSYGRLGDAALRVAALCASAESSGHVIEYEHWAVAQAQAEKWRESLHRLYAQVNSASEPTSGPTLDDRVIEYVQRLQVKHPPSARDVAKSLHMDTSKVEPVLASLVRDGVLTAHQEGRTCRYTSDDFDGRNQ